MGLEEKGEGERGWDTEGRTTLWEGFIPKLPKLLFLLYIFFCWEVFWLLNFLVPFLFTESYISIHCNALVKGQMDDIKHSARSKGTVLPHWGQREKKWLVPCPPWFREGWPSLLYSVFLDKSARIPCGFDLWKKWSCLSKFLFERPTRKTIGINFVLFNLNIINLFSFWLWDFNIILDALIFSYSGHVLIFLSLF